jgi:hypothetical protein
VFRIEQIGPFTVTVEQPYPRAGLEWHARTGGGFHRQSGGRFYQDCDGERIHGKSVEDVADTCLTAARRWVALMVSA